MAIRSEDVKKLRDETGVGMMDCKRALVEAQGDFARAKQLLREQGLELMGHKGREANEGSRATSPRKTSRKRTWRRRGRSIGNSSKRKENRLR